jgi:hypothetical protein
MATHTLAVVPIEHLGEATLIWAARSVGALRTDLDRGKTPLPALDKLFADEGIIFHRPRGYQIWFARKRRDDGSGMNHVAQGISRSSAGLRLFLEIHTGESAIAVPMALCGFYELQYFDSIAAGELNPTITMPNTKFSGSCPNCMQHPAANHPENGCVLASMIQLVRERGNHSEEEIQTLHATCDTDALWAHLGPLLDKLEDGEFSFETVPNGETEAVGT